MHRDVEVSAESLFGKMGSVISSTARVRSGVQTLFTLSVSPSPVLRELEHISSQKFLLISYFLRVYFLHCKDTQAHSLEL